MVIEHLDLITIADNNLSEHNHSVYKVKWHYLLPAGYTVPLNSSFKRLSIYVHYLFCPLTFITERIIG